MIERLRAERDEFERAAGRLRLAAYEATVWLLLPENKDLSGSDDVYIGLANAIGDEQSKDPTP